MMPGWHKLRGGTHFRFRHVTPPLLVVMEEVLVVLMSVCVCARLSCAKLDTQKRKLPHTWKGRTKKKPKPRRLIPSGSLSFAVNVVTGIGLASSFTRALFAPPVRLWQRNGKQFFFRLPAPDKSNGSWAWGRGRKNDYLPFSVERF